VLPTGQLAEPLAQLGNHRLVAVWHAPPAVLKATARVLVLAARGLDDAVE
jgi:hypothetical protein